MSYCRFGEADAYVYVSAEGLVCSSCMLLTEGDVILHSNEAMIDHLAAHQMVGHYIPETAFARLRDSADAANNKARWSKQHG